MEIIQAPASVKNLPPEAYSKWLKFGKRGYDLCGQTLERLFDYKEAVYDQKLDMFFKNHKSRLAYLKVPVAQKKKNKGTTLEKLDSALDSNTKRKL